MKKIIIATLLLLTAVFVKAQTFPNVDSVKKFINDSIQSNAALKASTLKKSLIAEAKFLPQIVQDTSSIVLRAHGMQVFQRKDSALYVFDTSGTSKKFRKAGSINSTDTSHLSARIDSKLNITDTTGKWVYAFYRKPSKDSLFVRINGIEIGVKDSIGSGASTDTSHLSSRIDVVNTGLANSLLQPYGQIYSGIAFSSGIFSTDFVQNGSVTFTDSSGHIIVSGGTSTFLNSLNIRTDQAHSINPYYTALEDWVFSTKFKVIQNGIMIIGIRPTISPTATNGAYAYLNTSSGQSTFLTGSSSNLTVNIGDYILMTAERHGAKTLISVRNLTTNSATITTASSFDLPTGNPPPTIGQFALFAYSGKFYVDSIGISSAANVNASVCVGGDSKFVGFNGTYQTRWPQQLGDNYTTIVEGGGFATSVDFLNVLPEWLALNSRQYLIGDFSNDQRTGIPLDSTKARYYRIERAIRGIGKDCYHINGFYESNSPNITWVNYINSTRSVDSLIYMYEATRIPGFLDADSTHATAIFGQNLAYKTVIAANKLHYGIDRLQSPSSYIANNTSTPQPAGFWINKLSEIDNQLLVGNSIPGNVQLIVQGSSDARMEHYYDGSNFNLFSINKARTNGYPVNLIGSTLKLQTYNSSAFVDALIFASNGAATFSKNIIVGSGSALGGSVAAYLQTHTNITQQLYSDGTVNNYYSSDNGRANGIDLNVVSGKFVGKTVVSGVATERFSYSTNELVINDPGNAYDFRVESDNNADMLHIDGTNDKVGIGTPTPTTALTVNGQVRINAINSSTNGIDSSVVINGGVLKATATNIGTTYQPTLTNITNVASSAAIAGSGHYIRVGNEVTYTITITVTPTASATVTQVGFSLPIFSNLTATVDLGGNGVAVGTSYNAAIVTGDATNDRGQIEFISSGTGVHTVIATGHYVVK